MESELLHFLQALAAAKAKNVDLAVGVIWFGEQCEDKAASPLSEVCQCIEDAGHSRPNITWLRGKLKKDKRVVKGKGKDTFRIHARHQAELSQQFAPFLARPKPKPSDSVLPRDLFDNTRGYIECVVAQINVSYDLGLYDCCTVMCRRLVETLIIEAYETQGRAAELKAPNGQFRMLGDLTDHAIADTTLNLTRNSQKGLKDFKKLGDLSAHNRRYLAKANDIDRVRDGLRVACEELLHLAFPS